MRLSKLLILLSVISCPWRLWGQEPFLPSPSTDVLSYDFRMALSDTSDLIQGEAWLAVAATGEALQLDLVKGQADDPKRGGMEVTAVEQIDAQGLPVRPGASECAFTHQNDRLRITPVQLQDTLWLRIRYRGKPRDGLIISQNRHGDRTFFGDNWPNRAHHWLPVVDHPRDKALVAFSVSAPDHYEVVSNGKLLKISQDKPGYRLHQWQSTVPLPVKVAVIGVARFARAYPGEVEGIPVSSWVYPQDQAAGFTRYQVAVGVLDTLIDYIGAYPYVKLANVQSTTRYGGMENASCIFYAESSVDQNSEALIAHEIVHQWFGNSASEASWYHLWLSEGFATYFTGLYLERRYGPEALQTYLQSALDRVLTSGPARPVVDSSVTDINALLNANSYQKGALVLHMLRRELGDAVFQRGIRTYYQRYQLSNALTADFQQVMEEVSGRELGWFFQQWLFRPENPQLDITWTYEAASQALSLTVNQTQPGSPFRLPLAVEVDLPDGPRRYLLPLQDAQTTWQVQGIARPTALRINPGAEVLVGVDLQKK